MRFRDRVGIIKDIGGIFDACGVSIYSILQNPIEDPADALYVIITDDVRPPHPEPMRARARALGSAPSVARALAGDDGVEELGQSAGSKRSVKEEVRAGLCQCHRAP